MTHPVRILKSTCPEWSVDYVRTKVGKVNVCKLNEVAWHEVNEKIGNIKDEFTFLLTITTLLDFCN